MRWRTDTRWVTYRPRRPEGWPLAAVWGLQRERPAALWRSLPQPPPTLMMLPWVLGFPVRAQGAYTRYIMRLYPKVTPP